MEKFETSKLYRQQKFNVFDQPEREELVITDTKPWRTGLYSPDHKRVVRKGEKPVPADSPFVAALWNMEYLCHRFMARAGYECCTDRHYLQFNSERDIKAAMRACVYASASMSQLRIYGPKLQEV